jgi:hypothetical protein
MASHVSATACSVILRYLGKCNCFHYRLCRSGNIRLWALVFIFLVLSGCGMGITKERERWIAPPNFVGWARLDYDIAGAPALARDHGFRVVKIPASGRLQTSSSYSHVIDENEYFLSTASGLKPLVFNQLRIGNKQPELDGSAVQVAFGIYRQPSWHVEDAAKCVFFGTQDARAQSGDCAEWKVGQPTPPKFPWQQ